MIDSTTSHTRFPMQLTAYIPFLKSWSESSPGTFAFISGVLPPTVSALFGWVLPIIMRKLTECMGAHTHSRMDRAVVARYYAFMVISKLIIFTLIGVIFGKYGASVPGSSSLSAYALIVSWRLTFAVALCRCGQAGRVAPRQACEHSGVL